MGAVLALVELGGTSQTGCCQCGRKFHGKCPQVGVHRDGGFTLIFGVGCLTPYFSVKSMGGHDVSLLLD